MKTSVNITDFKKRINHLVEEIETEATPLEKEEVPEAIPEEPVVHHYHQAYQEASHRILKDIIEPRVDALAEAFDNASMSVSADIGYIRLNFSSEAETLSPYLFFCILHDRSEKRIKVYTENCLRPYSTACQPEAAISFDLDEIDYEEISRFTESIILAFLRSYLLAKQEND